MVAGDKPHGFRMQRGFGLGIQVHRPIAVPPCAHTGGAVSDIKSLLKSAVLHVFLRALSPRRRATKIIAMPSICITPHAWSSEQTGNIKVKDEMGRKGNRQGRATKLRVRPLSRGWPAICAAARTLDRSPIRITQNACSEPPNRRPHSWPNTASFPQFRARGSYPFPSEGKLLTNSGTLNLRTRRRQNRG